MQCGRQGWDIDWSWDMGYEHVTGTESETPPVPTPAMSHQIQLLFLVAFIESTCKLQQEPFSLPQNKNQTWEMVPLYAANGPTFFVIRFISKAMCPLRFIFFFCPVATKAQLSGHWGDSLERWQERTCEGTASMALVSDSYMTALHLRFFVCKDTYDT